MANIYVTAAFKSSRKHEAYIFMKNEYVKEKYSPGHGSDMILYGPGRNRDFPSLSNTIFADTIDCAFGSHDPGEAYIFAWNNCAKWAYPSDNSGGAARILKGPMPIATMFPFLKGTVFENGVDAAFESSRQYETYLFKGTVYARINYSHRNPHLMGIRNIFNYWPMLRCTIFEHGGFDAALASEIENEVYFFKGDSYVRVKVTPGHVGGHIIGRVSKIKDHWRHLGHILPRRS